MHKIIKEARLSFEHIFGTDYFESSCHEPHRNSKKDLEEI